LRKVFSLFILVSSTLWVASAFAADVTIHILDPNGRAVGGARVALFVTGGKRAVTTLDSDSTGTVIVRNLSAGGYELSVQAPGFAASSRAVRVAADSEVEVKLAVAAPPETAVVTATETPLTENQIGAPTELVTQEMLINLQPVAASEAIRFLPGAIVNTAGRRGGQASLFVRGGESRYNKVIIDGVPVNDPGGTFDFGVVPTIGFDRMEFVRGPQSVTYGSDAMTSTVQMFSTAGSTRIPELRLGADGGTFGSARGYTSVAGAYRRFDYNLFGEQFNTDGQGVNDGYSNSAAGANLGAAISPKSVFRFRTRHSTERSGVQSFFNFNGRPIVPPDADQFARQNNFLASAEFDLTAPQNWKHSFSGFEYNHRRLNQDKVADRTCAPPAFLDCDFSDLADINRAGFTYRGEYAPRTWARSVFGYEFEDENGFINQNFSGFLESSHGLRRNHAIYGEQLLTFSRWSLLAGIRYVHNENFGDRGVPRAAVTFLARKGTERFAATRLRFAYGEGIKEPRLEESFGAVGEFGVVTLPNKNLKAEENRSLETGVVQEFFGNRASISAIYYNNLFKNQIAFNFDPVTFESQYLNLNRALAHGAEFEFHSRLAKRLSVDSSYIYTSTQILRAPLATDPLLLGGRPLLRRPKHAGSVTLNYFAQRWGANLSSSLIGRRVDSDFGLLSSLGLPGSVNHAAGYARVDAGGWYALTNRVSAYLNIENLLNKHYEEVAGYPALHANFRVGMRFKLGGE